MLVKEQKYEVIKRFYSYLPAEIRYGKSYILMYYFTIFSIWLSKRHKNLFIKLYYSDLFKLKYKIINTKNDINKLVDDNNKDNKNLLTIITGGTTGNPMKFYVDKNYHKEFSAIRHALWSNWGFKKNSRILSLNYKFKEDSIFFYNYRDNSLDINLGKIKNINSVIFKSIVDWNPKYIIGYPSSLLEFENLVSEIGIPLVNLKLIISGSEKLHKWQKNKIENTFKVQIKSWYGMSEAAAFAYQCPFSNEFHFLPNIGLIELESSDENYSNGEGEILVTKKNQNGTPFTRYRTGDIGSNYHIGCKSCGANLQTLSDIKGRTQDYLDDLDGNKIYISNLNTHDINLDKIKSFQFVQYSKSLINANYIPKNGYEHEARNQFQFYINTKFGNNNIFINRVDELERTSRNKIQLIIKKEFFK